MLRHGPHVRRHEPIRLPQWQEWAIYGAFGLMAGSGLLWLLFHFALQVQTPFDPQPAPLEYQWLRLHGASAMLGLVVLGSLLPVHIRRAWELHRNRLTGLIMSGACALLIVSGYLLYYFASEQSRPWISVAHWGFGLVVLPSLAWHVWAGQQRRSVVADAAESGVPAADSF